MCHVAFDAAGFPRERVIGMAGVLDSARFRAFIAMELGVSVEDVTRDGARRSRRHDGAALALLDGRRRADHRTAPADRVTAIEERTAKGGAEIVGLLKTGSAYYAPGMSVGRDGRRDHAGQEARSAVQRSLKGEYGINDLYVGVPIKLGAGGVEQIIELNLTSDESAALKKSSGAVKELVEAMASIRAST